MTRGLKNSITMAAREAATQSCRVRDTEQSSYLRVIGAPVLSGGMAGSNPAMVKVGMARS